MGATRPPAALPVWALVQTRPRRATLAVSSDRRWLKAEAQELADIQADIGDRTRHEWHILPLEPVSV